MKEYVPDYESRITYAENRNKSEFRRNLYEIIQVTKGFPFRRHFPIEPAAMIEAINAEYPIVTLRLNILIDIEKRLKAMAKLRDREPEKRWQAHYDLMLAEIMTYQIKAYEYRACLEEMAKNPPKPKTMPNPSLVVEWVLDHSQDRKAPKEKTEKVYAEAITLLKKVIERHPKTPWADLAQDELNRGLGVQRNEWHHNPQYGERAKLVPKY
jgi:antitoxin component HigA of HigAB toxin-antitoxin module